MTTTRLKKPIVRLLDAHDGTRFRRPLFISIEPEGAITIWPRRCRPEVMFAMEIYARGAQLRKATAKSKNQVGRQRGRHG